MCVNAGYSSRPWLFTKSRQVQQPQSLSAGSGCTHSAGYRSEQKTCSDRLWPQRSQTARPISATAVPGLRSDMCSATDNHPNRSGRKSQPAENERPTQPRGGSALAAPVLRAEHPVGERRPRDSEKCKHNSAVDHLTTLKGTTLSRYARSMRSSAPTSSWPYRSKSFSSRWPICSFTTARGRLRPSGESMNQAQ